MANNIIIENAHIFWRNFSGKESKYNPAGERNFCVRIDDEKNVELLKADGWNIKEIEAKKEDDEKVYYIPVEVSFKYWPPKVVLVTRNNMTNLTEETVGELDGAEIKNVDLVIRPYEWEVNKKSGIKAYLKTLYAIIEEDEFAYKYQREYGPEDE